MEGNKFTGHGPALCVSIPRNVRPSGENDKRAKQLITNESDKPKND